MFVRFWDGEEERKRKEYGFNVIDLLKKQQDEGREIFHLVGGRRRKGFLILGIDSDNRSNVTMMIIPTAMVN